MPRNEVGPELWLNALLDIVTETGRLPDGESAGIAFANPEDEMEEIIRKVKALAKEALVHTNLTKRKSTHARYRHLKRGSTYQVESVIAMQCSTDVVREGDLVVVYRAEDGIGCGRKLQEFKDGRFEQI